MTRHAIAENQNEKDGDVSAEQTEVEEAMHQQASDYRARRQSGDWDAQSAYNSDIEEMSSDTSYYNPVGSLGGESRKHWASTQKLDPQPLKDSKTDKKS